MEFGRERYDKALDEFHKKVGLVCDGKSSEKLAQNIDGKMKDK